MNLNSRRRWAWLLCGVAGLVFVFGGCDLLFGIDMTPPTCTIQQPGDSSAVSGVVQFRVDAYDTSGVDRVSFYVDGVLLGVDSVVGFAVEWDTRSLVDQSWHSLSCTAVDVYDNVGQSDTVHVQVWHGGQRDLLHGSFRLDPSWYVYAGFTADVGDTLAGDLRVLDGRRLGRLLWFDPANYAEFRQGNNYTALLELQDVTEVSVREAIPAADSFYFVLWNSSGPAIDLWARFTLE